MSEQDLKQAFPGARVLAEDAVTRVTAGGRLAGWRFYERRGVTVYKDAGPPYPPAKLLEPVCTLEGLAVGQKLLVPHYFVGGYNRVTVTEARGAYGSARGEEVFVSLQFDGGVPGVFGPEWVASFVGCRKGLELIDFS